MKKTKLTGALVASAVAGLFLAGRAMSEEKKADQPAKKSEEAKVCCDGGNSCKGKGDCSSVEHSCSGRNSCKGKGWVKVSSDECKKAGGKVIDCPKM